MLRITINAANSTRDTPKSTSDTLNNSSEQENPRSCDRGFLLNKFSELMVGWILALSLDNLTFLSDIKPLANVG